VLRRIYGSSRVEKLGLYSTTQPETKRLTQITQHGCTVESVTLQWDKSVNTKWKTRNFYRILREKTLEKKSVGNREDGGRIAYHYDGS
jgi:hypothetical protein